MALAPHGHVSRYVVRALVVFALGALILWPIRQGLNNPVAYRNLIAFFCLGLGVWSILERSSQQEVRVPALIAVPLVAAAGLSLLFLFKGSASLSQLVTVLCALLGAMLLFSLIFPAKLSPAPIVPLVSVFIVLFMAVGHFYLDINPWHMIYLAFPFLVLWVRRSIPVPRQALIEAAGLALLAAAPLAYFLWTQYKISGPLP
ncbi:MAG: acyl-CoA synthetase [Calothrix sp. SM1_5_4]|nr:acyl-CoA synthetase [Calothrix sp. SM1_5_4]